MRPPQNHHIDEESDNPDRWLLSYADFITLLMAFFVVMYAISSVQEKKYTQLKQSVRLALGSTTPESPRPLLPASSQTASVPESPAEPTAYPRMDQVVRDLESKLAPLIASHIVRISKSAEGISIEINASILFPMAQADLQPQSISTLEKVSDVLKEYGYPIHVAGHTDNIQINSKEFPSNWELSAARASRVVRLFESSGINRQRMMAIGYADTRPVASNDTIEGRMSNRRVQILLEQNISALPLQQP